MADGYSEGSQVSIRPYAKARCSPTSPSELGLKNAWTGEGDEVYGLAQTDVEGLTASADGNFLYIANARRRRPVRGELADNAVWTSLPFVEERRVHRLPDGIWMFGGPTSTEQYVDAVVQAVTS